MRFLFTVASYYPTAGGVQMVTQYTAEELVKRGHEVTVLTSTHDCKEYVSEHNGVKILYCDLYKKMDFIVGNKKSYKQQLVSLCQQMDVLVNVSLQTPTTDIAMRLLNEIHCKKILYLHDIYDFKWREWDFSGIGAFLKKCYYNLSRRIYYSYVHKYMSKYNLITHLSPFDISMRYVKRHKITQNLVLGNAALDSVFNKKHIKDTTTSPYFICIANYNDRKNQKFVLEAFYKTHFEREVKLVFIGKERNQYYYSLTEKKKLLDNLYGYRDVVFMTGVPREDTERLLSNAIAFVLGSKTEMFPVVIVEAMASSIPFISTDVGCVRYQPGGFIVNNADEMAYWMQFLIDNPLLGSKIGLIGYEYAHIKMTIESRINILLKAVELL